MAKGNSRRIEDILNNPADKSKLDNSIDEYVRLLDSISDKKESMKVIVDDIREKIGIDPKMFKTLAGITQKNNAAEKLKEAENLETAIGAMFAIHEDGDA
jgi:hypothetical protein